MTEQPSALVIINNAMEYDQKILVSHFADAASRSSVGTPETSNDCQLLW